MSSVWTIRRSTSEAKVSGVCGGVARHWGVDPVLVRIGCALLALSGGIGVVLYIAGWLLLPKEGHQESVVFDIVGPQARQWTREVWLVLVGVCCLVTFALLAPVTPFGIGPAAILALVWYFGYYKHAAARSSRSAAAQSQQRPDHPPAGLASTPAEPQHLTAEHPDTPFGQAAQVWRQRIAQVQADAARFGPTSASVPWSAAQHSASAAEGYEPAGPASALPPVASWSAAPAPYADWGPGAGPVSMPVVPSSRSLPIAPRSGRATSRSARRLRLASLAVLALTLAALGAAEVRGLPVPSAGYFSAALLVLGLTLVAAAWLGRARGLLPLALLVLLATVATTTVGPVARSLGWQSQQQTYTSTSDLHRGDQRARGQLQVDLTQLRVSSDAAYNAHVGVGTVEVSMPRNTDVVVNWHVRAGAVILNDTLLRSGSDLHGTERFASQNPNSKTLVLNLSVDQGVVQVRR